MSEQLRHPPVAEQEPGREPLRPRDRIVLGQLEGGRAGDERQRELWGSGRMTECGPHRLVPREDALIKELGGE